MAHGIVNSGELLFRLCVLIVEPIVRYLWRCYRNNVVVSQDRDINEEQKISN